MGLFALLIRLQIFWKKMLYAENVNAVRREGMPSRQEDVEVVNGKLLRHWSLFLL